MVSTTACLASTCRQCLSAGSSLAWGLKCWALVCYVAFSEALNQGAFSGYSGFLPPSLANDFRQ